jgi:hypothetical protein
MELMTPGERMGVAAEYARLGAGEPRSEIVRQYRAGGVASARQCRRM